MTRYQNAHHVRIGKMGDPKITADIERMARADEDKGLREAEAYGEPPVRPLYNGEPMPGPAAEFYGHAIDGSTIGPYDTAHDRDVALRQVDDDIQVRWERDRPAYLRVDHS